MSEVKLFELPTENDSTIIIERKYLELSKRYREGDKLDDVEVSWMDYANNYLFQK